jgi:hypothetical protein
MLSRILAARPWRSPIYLPIIIFALATSNSLAAVPAVTSAGLGCSDLSCVSASGSNFTTECTVDLYSDSYVYLGTPTDVYCSDSLVTFRLPETIQSLYSVVGIAIINGDNQWNSPYFLSIERPAPKVTDAGLGCSDSSCIWATGENFTTQCTVDLYSHDYSYLGKPTGISCSDKLITFRLPLAIQALYPSIRFAIVNQYHQWNNPHHIDLAIDATLVKVRANADMGATIRPVWNTVNIWDISQAPTGKLWPFMDQVILMTATGGRIWYRNQDEPSEVYPVRIQDGALAFNFKKLDDALDSITCRPPRDGGAEMPCENTGLRPIVVIGNTPEALSTRRDPDISLAPPKCEDRDGDGKCEFGFATNKGEPSDYEQYRLFMENLFKHLLERYPDHVAEWGFRLMTEPDCIDWWDPISGDRLGEYEKLYDVTLRAMREAGIGNSLNLGNLCWTSCDSSLTWDSGLLAWFDSAPQPGYARQSDIFSFSAYGSLDGGGQLGADPRNLIDVAARVRSKLSGTSLAMARIAVDEGGLFRKKGTGFDCGEIEYTAALASWTAGIIKATLDADLERFAFWPVQLPPYDSICRVREGERAVYELFERMRGMSRTSASVSGAAHNSASYVDAIAARSSSNRLGVLVFNYGADISMTTAQPVVVAVSGLQSDRPYTANYYHAGTSSELIESRPMQTSALGILAIPLSLAPNEVTYIELMDP